MPTIARTARDMIRAMAPELRAGSFGFVTVTDPHQAASLWPEALAAFREDEGLSLILPAGVAKRAGLPVAAPMRCITLTVHSALDGVGLTAAVATALAARGIPCNMVAAFHHDHVFVPVALADAALLALRALQEAADGEG